MFNTVISIQKYVELMKTLKLYNNCRANTDKCIILCFGVIYKLGEHL